MTTDNAQAPSAGGEKGPTTIIQAGADLVTLVNVFTVAPDKQQTLVDLLVEATDSTMRHLPGFISANIHPSLDGKRVINYAQWRSKADFEALQKDEKAGKHMKKAAALAAFQPTLCEVVSVHSAEGT